MAKRTEITSAHSVKANGGISTKCIRVGTSTTITSNSAGTDGMSLKSDGTTGVKWAAQGAVLSGETLILSL